VFQTSNQELFIQGILLLPGSHHIWIFSVVFAEVLHIRVFEVRKNYAKKKKQFLGTINRSSAHSFKVSQK
jgi:hypothetical protein